MQRAVQEFVERLAVGPAFLLVGQGIGQDESGLDPVLAHACDTLGIAATDVVAALPAEVRSRAYEVMAGDGRTAELSPGLIGAAGFAWNGVYTTAIDSRVARAFQADWRRVTTAVGDQRVPHPRNAADLTVRLLFGGTGEPPDRWPPVSALDVAAKRNEAMQSLTALAGDVITPRGVLAIAGWATSEWIRPEDLYSILTRTQPGQVHLFSATDAHLADDFVAGAVSQGLLVAHRESLAEILAEATEGGLLPDASDARDAGVRVLPLGPAGLRISRDEWTRVVASARPIDVELLAQQRVLSPDLEYQRFRDFLGASEGEPDWPGIVSGYPFRRTFEDDLFKRVMARLADADPTPPLILEGQTGVGKSTALAGLAVRVASRRTAAVLHVGRLGERPNVSAIDQFALWVEEEAGAPTLLIWDGMGDVEDYFSAFRQLRSRGRKVHLVGSAYRLSDRRSGAVTAPAHLEPGEPERLQAWLSQYGIGLADVDLALVAEDASFLAALYRLLPESRSGLERGLTLELRTVERDMERFARVELQEPQGELTIMAAALLQAGIELPPFAPAGDDRPVEERDFSERSTAEQLTGIVLVAGRRGLRVPLELILRVVGREGSAAVIDVVKRFDIVRWSEDDTGDQYLGTRTALEAELLARTDLRDARLEVEIIASLLSSVKPSHGAGGPEVQFLMDLLNRVGPASPETGRFRRHYLSLANALAEGRLQPGRAHPRLMLMEANLRREYVKASQAADWVVAGDRLDVLDEAQRVLEEALEGVSASNLQLNLLTELASTLGAKAYELSASEDTTGRVAILADRIVELVNQARALDPENYYPVDVIAWVCARIAQRKAVDPGREVGLVADTFAAFASIDPEALSPRQRAQYDSRLAQVATLMNEDALAENHLAALLANDDPAAYYLRALHESQLLFGDATQESAQGALAGLLDSPAEVRADWRCARLTLDLFWLARTGNRFLAGEREALAFDDSDWEACLDVLDRIQPLAADAYRAEFLRGLALFHLRRYRLAMDVFKALERTAVTLSRRVIATYVASTPQGEPVRFTGQVRSVTPDYRSGYVWVDELGIELKFIPYRFAQEGLERGNQLPEFFVAFNFRGPYADPVRTSRPSRPEPAR